MAKDKEENVPTLSEMETKELLNEIQGRGYYIAKTPLQQSGQTFKGDMKRWSGNKYRFGVVSDTHLCSRYQQLTYLYDFYRICQRRKIQTVLHCGDLCDGERIYRGHEYEIFIHGADGQIEYAVDNYPRFKGIRTILISGNHDQSFLKTSGINIARYVAKERDDITFLGDDLAFIEQGKIKIAMFHGRGGVAYARSYKLQKVLEQIAPEHKPHLFFMGHYHVPNYLPGYRNVEGWQLPCFQSQTPYLVSKGLYPFVAGLIVTVQEDESGISKVMWEIIPFFKMREKDF